MKEKLKNKKVVYTIIGLVSVLLVMIAVTYAYWLVTKTQTNENEITAACLDISISGEKNDITLTNQFPMSDEDGMKLTPYEFTVTNNCNTSVDYQVALEATGDSSNALKGTSLKVALNDNAKLYSTYPSIETTISGSYESRKLIMGTLASSGTNGSTATYSLRMWIDENAPISEMNKTFKSRISVTVGQGIINNIITNPIKEGTLAYSILSNVGGVNAISEIDASEWDHAVTATGNSYISTSGDYYYGTEYTFDETTKEYTLSGTLTQATITECRNGTKTCGKYTFKDIRSTKSSTMLYEVTDFQSSGNYVTANTWGYVNAFSKGSDSNEAGLYKTQDDIGDSYYYRGNVTNNYVQFGSYAAGSTVNGTTYNEEMPMYWRIVRINGDGTIRLVYDGTTKAENGIEHASNVGTSAFNSNYDNAKYVGYTYDDGNGNQVDSTIKGALDTWYDTHLKANYEDKIADSIFCNDRDVTRTSGTTQNYGANQRLDIDRAPSLKCPNQSDRYTVDDITNGNGLLKNPVGLITADEEVLAGAFSGSPNKSYYLYNGGYYWTSTPAFWNVSDGGAFVYILNYGSMSAGHIGGESGVRPVISLKADVKFTGNGSFETPYKIVTE